MIPALWIFGYGSLIWRPDFPHVERRPGFVADRARRFWQGSTDHRGVPEAPGRVVTLVADPGAACWGMAYGVRAADRDAVLRALDARESGGFARREVDVHFADAPSAPRRALAWVAEAGNRNYLGPAPLAAIARQVRRARGPSGTNAEYVLRLATALRAIGAPDPHVFAVASRVAGPRPGAR